MRASTVQAPRPVFAAAVAAALAACLAGTPTVAGDPTKGGTPTAAAARVRAAIPAPAEGMGFEFAGDLEIAGENAGSVRYVVDVGEYREKPVWLVTEETQQDWHGLKSKTETSLYLARDLSLLRGEATTTTAEGESVQFTFVRKEGGLEVARVATVKGVEQPAVTKTVEAAAEATFGRGALLLFLRYAPKGTGAYALPLFAPERALAAPGASEDDPATDAAPIAIEAKGPAKYGKGPTAKDSWMASVRMAGRAFEVHLAPKDRTLLGVVGVAPPVHVVPKGTSGARTVAEDEKPATTWKAAFLKFGHGYHMAKRPLIEAAFHWPTMYAHEVASGSWPKDKPVEEFKEAWIQEFLAESKHRSQADADGLLLGTLATGNVNERGADNVVFEAHASYGGGVQRTYHLRRIDGVWYIIRID